MGQNLSSNNLNENKLIDKSSFIDELIGDKTISKQHNNNSAKIMNSKYVFIHFYSSKMSKINASSVSKSLE